MKDKAAAGIFAIFLGAFGAHHFYLGNTEKGVAYLLISLLTFGVGAVVISIISLIEGIRYICMSDEEFALLAQNKKPTSTAPSQEEQKQDNGYLQKMDKLKKARALLENGAITEQEYDIIKTKILGE